VLFFHRGIKIKKSSLKREDFEKFI